jgi:hypothetical protein
MPTRQSAIAIPPTADAIEYRAFELFVERGGEHGNDVEDWLRAERELAPPREHNR